MVAGHAGRRVARAGEPLLGQLGQFDQRHEQSGHRHGHVANEVLSVVQTVTLNLKEDHENETVQNGA